MDESSVEILWETQQSALDPDQVRRFACEVMKMLSPHPHELSLLVCDDDRIQVLNRDYRHMDKPTDVLSFPSGESTLEPSFLGDLALAWPTIQRQAIEFKVTPEYEFRKMMIHGILHLFGYDHETGDADAARMAAEEARIQAATESFSLC